MRENQNNKNLSKTNHPSKQILEHISDTKSVESLLNWLRSYAKFNLNIDEMNQNQKIPENFIREAGKQGLLGMWIPNEYGGIELTLTDTLKIIEQLAAINITLAAFLVLQHTCSFSILSHATPQFRKRFLPQMAKGKAIGCFALSELNAGSNPRAMTTSITAISDDKWLINGTKCWLGSAASAGIFIVFATHTSGTYKGISCFAIPSDSAGIEIGSPIKCLGVHALNLRTVTLRKVEVSHENLLGEYTRGMMVAESVLMRGRLFASALSIGIMKRSAQIMLRYASRRSVGTGLLLENPVTISRLTDLDFTIVSSSILNRKVSEELDAKRKVPHAALMACKVFASEMAWKTTDNLVQLLGARGLDECNIASQMLRDTRFLRIGEGPTETLLMELGAILCSKDSSTLQFILTCLNGEQAYSRLIETIDEIQKITSIFSECPLNYVQWQYFNLGQLGIWSFLEASLEFEIKNSINSPILSETLEWIKEKFSQKLIEVKTAQTKPPSWNSLTTISDRISQYDYSIGNLDDTIAINQEKLDPLLRKAVVPFKVNDQHDGSYYSNILDWKKSDFTARINLHTDRLLNNKTGYHQITNKSILDNTFIKNMTDLGNAAGHSLEDTLFSVFSLLLSRLSEQTEVEILRYDVLQKLTSAVRVNLNGEPHFKEFLQDLNTRITICEETWTSPSEAKIDLQNSNESFDSNPEQSILSAGAIVCFCFGQNPSVDALKGVDLCLTINHTQHGLTFSWIHNEAFTHETIVHRSRNLSTLLNATSISNESIYKLKLIPTEEQNLINEMSGLTQKVQIAHSYTTIPELFENHLKVTPDHIALVSHNETFTYKQLDEKVNQLAHLLKDSNIRPGDVVGFFMGRTTCFITSLLATLKVGATLLTLNIRHPKERNQLVIKEAKTKFILTEQNLLNLLPCDDIKILCVDSNKSLKNYPTSHFNSLATADSIAYIIFTSGSTGSPKGVVVSQQAICDLLICRRDTFKMTQHDRVLYLSVPNFDIAVWEFFGGFAAGGSIALSGDNSFTWDPKETAELIHRYKVTHIQISPTQLNLLLLSSPDISYLCSSLKYVFSGGEALPKQVQEKFFTTLSAKLIPVYGSTEAVLDVTSWHCKPQNSHSVAYIGHVFSNKRVYILDKYLQHVPIGVPGELYIGGQNLAEGYLDQPQLTKFHFLPDPFFENPNARIYRSKDSARFLTNGGLEFLGRVDQQIKINGLRIEPGEIETILEKHPDIKQLRVAAKKNRKAKLSSILVAYYVTLSEEISCEKSLRELALNQLPKEMIPSLFIQLKTLPLTNTGKLDIKALPDIDSLNIPSASKKWANANPTLNIIVNIWEDLLDRNVPEETSDFFELGGHSLIAVQVLTHIREALAIEISLSEFFNAPTIHGLYEKIKTAEKLENHAPVMCSRDGLIPLAGTQENLWYLHKLNPESSAYNCPEALRLQGKLNIENLQWALQKIIARHESLRTLFKIHEGHPIQIRLSKTNFNLPVIDLSTISIDKREQTLNDAIKTEASRAFHLDEELLFKALVFKMSDEDHVFFWNFHHIVADGWSSARVFTTELSEIYSARTEERQCHLPNIDIQAIDYMFWQKKYLSEAKLNKQREFWKKELDGAPSEIDLSLGHPQSAKPSEQGCRIFLNIPNELLASLHNFSQQKNFTSFEVLMTAFASLAHIFSGDDDIPIGTVVAGRKHSSIEHVIGNFANVVVVRNDISGTPTFHTLLERLRNKMLDIMDNSDIPFEDVVSVIKPNRRLYKNPLFNVFLSLYNGNLNDLKMTGLKQKDIQCYQDSAQFDFSMAFFESKNSLEGYIEYKKDLFEHETVKRIANYYLKIVYAVIHNSNSQLNEIELVGDKEKNLLINTWNDFYAPFPHEKCLHQLFEAQVERTPKKTAITFGEMSLNYAELNQKANQIARYLRQLDVQSGDLIGMCVTPSIEMIVGLLGIIKAGAAYVPIDPELPSKRINFIVEEINAKVILTQYELVDCIKQCGTKIICLDSDWHKIGQQKDNNLNIQMTSDDPVYMIFTSGSTGIPKGVETLHRNVSALICNTNHMQGNDSDIFAKVNNFAFDISTWEIWTPLILGASIVGIPEYVKFVPQEFARFILKQGITMLYLPTALFHSISSELPSAFACLKLLVVGGESLDPNRAREVLHSNPPKGFINAYGPTEVTCNAAWFDVYKQSPQSARVPIGRPISNTQFYVLNKNQKLLPIGAKGELYIGGAGVSRGYRQRQELTQKHFLPNPFLHDKKFTRFYRTGDIVRYLSNGNLEFLGRIDHQVKIRGFRIEIGEIESALREHKNLREAIVLIREDSPSHKRLVAFISFHNNAVSSLDSLKSHLKERIPSYMMPSVFVTLESLPLNTNGKVDRNKLKAIEISIEDAKGNRAYPRNEFEVRLLRIWENIIGFKSSSIHTNFFDAGGDSLRAVQLLSAINKEFSKQLPLELLYEEGTIESLAVQLRAHNILPSGSVLIPLYKSSSHNSPLFLVHPLSGSAMCYNPLARSLNYPLFGLQSASLETDAKPLDSIEAMATNYLKALMKVQNVGPFFIGGWSFGGVVAFEMVRQLESQGHKVSGIILFDSAAPDKAQKTLNLPSILKLCLEEITEQFGIKTIFNMDGFNTTDSETLFQAVLQQVKNCGAYPPDTEVSALERMVEVCLVNAKAIESYKQKNNIQCDIVLFRAEDYSRIENMLIDPTSAQEPCLGWSSLTNGKVSVFKTQGNHMSMLFQKNVELLAPMIRKHIELLSNKTKNSSSTIINSFSLLNTE